MKNPRYTGSYQCLKSLLVKDGIRGIYRGISSPLAGVAAINAIIFGVYGNAQRLQKDPSAIKSCVIAGAAAGLCQSFLTGPMELIKTRMQISGGDQSPLRMIRDIFKTEGTRGIFRGLNITILRELPAFSSYFLTYEYLTRTPDNSPVSTWTMLIAGGFAGVVSWMICYPIDIVKSRMQIDGMKGPKIYKNSLDCLRKSVDAEGYSFLIRGLTPAIVRAFPVNAACFTVVTWTMRLFETTSSMDTGELPICDTLWYNVHASETAALFL